MMMMILHVDDDDDDFACPTQPMTLRGCELLRAIQLETPLLYSLRLLLQYEEEDDDGDKLTLRPFKIPFWESNNLILTAEKIGTAKLNQMIW